MILKIESREGYNYDFFVTTNSKEIYYIDTFGEYGAFNLYEFHKRNKIAEIRAKCQLPYIIYNTILLYQTEENFEFSIPLFSLKKKIEYNGYIFEIKVRNQDMLIYKNQILVANFKNNRKGYSVYSSFDVEIFEDKYLEFYIAVFLALYF